MLIYQRVAGDCDYHVILPPRRDGLESPTLPGPLREIVLPSSLALKLGTPQIEFHRFFRSRNIRRNEPSEIVPSS